VPDKVVTESDQIACSDGISLRVAALPGHTAESLGFIVEPYSFLIGDEVLGFYKGRELAAPGCDDSIERSLETLGKIEKLALSGLGLPNFGALSGELIRRHLRAVIENTTDLVREVRAAVVSGVPRTVIEQNILDAFYRTESRDPCVLEGLERTFQNIKRQLLATN